MTGWRRIEKVGLISLRSYRVSKKHFFEEWYFTFYITQSGIKLQSGWMKLSFDAFSFHPVQHFWFIFGAENYLDFGRRIWINFVGLNLQHFLWWLNRAQNLGKFSLSFIVDKRRKGFVALKFFILLQNCNARL